MGHLVQISAGMAMAIINLYGGGLSFMVSSMTIAAL